MHLEMMCKTENDWLYILIGITISLAICPVRYDTLSLSSLGCVLTDKHKSIVERKL